MEARKVSMFMQEKEKWFPAEKVMYVKEKIDSLDESKSYLLDTIPLKNPMVYFIVALFLPGVEKMMLGEVATGLLKLLTLGGFFIWWFIDLFTITKRVKELNFSKFMSLL